MESSLEMPVSFTHHWIKHVNCNSNRLSATCAYGCGKVLGYGTSYTRTDIGVSLHPQEACGWRGHSTGRTGECTVDLILPNQGNCHRVCTWRVSQQRSLWTHMVCQPQVYCWPPLYWKELLKETTKHLCVWPALGSVLLPQLWLYCVFKHIQFMTC